MKRRWEHIGLLAVGIFSLLMPWVRIWPRYMIGGEKGLYVGFTELLFTFAGRPMDNPLAQFALSGWQANLVYVLFLIPALLLTLLVMNVVKDSPRIRSLTGAGYVTILFLLYVPYQYWAEFKSFARDQSVQIDFFIGIGLLTFACLIGAYRYYISERKELWIMDIDRVNGDADVIDRASRILSMDKYEKVIDHFDEINRRKRFVGTVLLAIGWVVLFMTSLFRLEQLGSILALVQFIFVWVSYVFFKDQIFHIHRSLIGASGGKSSAVYQAMRLPLAFRGNEERLGMICAGLSLLGVHWATMLLNYDFVGIAAAISTIGVLYFTAVMTISGNYRSATRILVAFTVFLAVRVLINQFVLGLSFTLDGFYMALSFQVAMSLDYLGAQELAPPSLECTSKLA